MTEGFSSKDIVSIIAACHKNRVKKIVWGDFQVEFSHGADEDQEGPVMPQHVVSIPDARDIEQTLKDEDPFYNQLAMQTLMMEDPAEFERQLMQEDQEAEEGAILSERTQHDVSGGRHSS